MEREQEHERGSYVAFPDTPWSLVRGAQQGAEAAERLAALNRLLERYWRPLYAYYRSKKLQPPDAENLVQEFFYALVSGDKLARMTPGVRFRHWLMACARNLLIQHQRREDAGIRRPAGGLRSLDALKKTGAAFEPADHVTPEQAFRDAWRRDLLHRAFESVHEKARAEDRMAAYEIFVSYYAGPPDGTVTWKVLADRYGLEQWKQAKNKADWAARQFAVAIRREIRRYVDSDEEVDEELRELLR